MQNPITDIHVHIQPLQMLRPEALALMQRQRRDFDRLVEFSENPASFLRFLDSIGVERAGIINYVSPDVMGFTHEVNDWVLRYCAADPRRLLAFGSVHPLHAADVAAEVDRLAAAGLRGLKVHPSHQLFAPNAYRDGLRALAQMYERAQQAGLVVMIHTGTSVFPHARNAYAQPMLVDDVAVDFPRLMLILAHGGRPLWCDEAVFLLRRHSNVYMDISSIPPQRLLDYFPRLEELADKVLFGSDWPGPGVPDIAGNIRKFLALPLSRAAQRKILWENAARLFPRHGP